MLEVLVPRENVNDQSVTVSKIYFETGGIVKKGDVVLVLETSKTNIDIEAPESGNIFHQLKEGEEIEVGKKLFNIGDISYDQSLEHNTGFDKKTIDHRATLVSKRAELKAISTGINLGNIGGVWISSRHVEEFGGGAESVIHENFDKQSNVISDSPEKFLIVSFQSMRQSRRKISEISNLSIGNNSGLTSTIGIEIEVLGGRRVAPPFIFEKTISDLIAYEAIKLLNKYPLFNACYLNHNEIAVYDSINLGWSFDVDDSLKVLAVEHCERLELGDFQEKILELFFLYVSGETIPGELLLNSTFTISDLTAVNIDYMRPLINGMQSAIIGITKPKNRFYKVYMTFDHRVASGLQAAKFLEELRFEVIKHFTED